jgi:thiamine-phosphate pyrophosphorylase
MVTYSPIFVTPNKGKAKGCEELFQVVQKVKIPVIALGGIISDEHIKQIELTGASGFASIRYFLL